MPLDWGQNTTSCSIFVVGRALVRVVGTWVFKVLTPSQTAIYCQFWGNSFLPGMLIMSQLVHDKKTVITFLQNSFVSMHAQTQLAVTFQPS